MDRLSTESNTVIYTAEKKQTVTLNLWNQTDSSIPGLNIKSDSEVFVKNGLMDGASKNNNPDTGIEIPLEAGEKIYAWCSIENAVEYQIVN